MALPNSSGIFIHEGYNCTPVLVPTAQSIPMSTSDNTTVYSAVDTILSDIADNYDPTSTYDVGDCVIYNKILYKCTAAISVAEPWDSTHWEEVKAVDVGSGGGGGASSLHDLTDVDDTGKTTGDTIVYNSADQEWVAKPITVTCTQAEYDAWASAVPSQIDPAILYLIMDAPMELPDASDVKYSNTISGLTATTVQAAIDEVNSKSTTENVMNLVTFTEDISGTNTRFYEKGEVLYIFYQGESKTHTTQETLFTLPSGYRPLNQLYTPFVMNNFGYGTVEISTLGVAKITNIIGGENTGRVYFNVSFPVE